MFLIITPTNATVTAYYDGAIVQTWSYSADYTPYNFTSVYLAVGGTEITYSDVRIYDKALSGEEASVLYKYGLPTTGMQLASNATSYVNKEIIEGL